MRLSEWRAAAPHKDAATAKVAAVVDPILEALGTGQDPHGWVVWGEESWSRYTILVPTDPGLVVCFVRVMVAGEGPRASAKLVRWARVALGELAIEAQQGHRLLSFQVEQQVLRGVDTQADLVAAFALRVIAAIDGRPLPPVAETARRGRRAGSPAGATTTTSKTAVKRAAATRAPAAASATADRSAGAASALPDPARRRAGQSRGR